MTRRTVLQALAAPALMRAAAPKATAFALVGDRYHNADYIRTGLGRTIGRNAGVSIDFTDEVKLLNAANLAGYKLLIIHRDGMLWPDGYADDGASTIVPGRNGPVKIETDPPVAPHPSQPFFWIQPEQGKALKEFVSGGGGVLFYHASNYISPHNDDVRDVLGAVTLNHTPIRRFKVKVENHDHPVTRGVNDFIITEDQHFMDYQKDAKYILIKSVNEDGLTMGNLGTTAPAGWAYDYGKGRVCYFAPGHLLSTLWNPEYEKLQKNAVRWLLKET